MGIGTSMERGFMVCVNWCAVLLAQELLQNEEGVGKAVRESGVPRENVWLTSKVSLYARQLYIADDVSGILSTLQTR